MPAPIRMVLNAEEDGTLLELSCADGVPHRTKQRATAIRSYCLRLECAVLLGNTSTGMNIRCGQRYDAGKHEV